MPASLRSLPVFLVTLAMVLSGALISSTAAQTTTRHRHFRHASTCGDYELYASTPGLSNRAWSSGRAGHYTGIDDGCSGETSTGRWKPDATRIKMVFRWYLGKTLIRKKVRRHCSGQYGCSDTLVWKHKFRIDDNGIRWYHGRRLTLRVRFVRRGFATKVLRTNPAYDSGYSGTY